MRFFQIAPVLALAGSAYAELSSSQVVSNINAITELSGKTNNVAESMAITNFFSTAPRVIDNFRQIITLATNDITAMTGGMQQKRALQARQECLDVSDVEQCVRDLFEIVEDPAEILGSKKKRQAAPPYDESSQRAICGAFREFVHVHQDLLRTVIGKHGLLSLTPFTQPLGHVLRILEGGVDQLAFAIIDTVPTCAEQATQNMDSLDMTLQNAVDQYS